MSQNDVKFTSPSGELLIHREIDGMRHLLIVPNTSDGGNHDHAVLRPNGNLVYLRENGVVKANDR